MSRPKRAPHLGPFETPREPAPPLRVARTPHPSPARAELVLARIEALDGERVRLAVGRDSVEAARDAAVHPAVLAGAHARGERVLAERGEVGAWVVVGALRTQPTPGIDVADAYTIEAERVTIRAGAEVTLTSRAASLVLRALGEVETYADRIVSRAEGVHKIVGRILRLN
ncbi:MAG: hypothetical protein IT373_32785 [Polyangiaceae bacterium]|nr:hypothetical protein [Polyangiaceae bacterium]